MATQMNNCFIGDYGPDADQLVCINAVEGIYVVVAGPGSGKTATLLQRHVNMLLHGIQQKDTLNLTFTHEAAEEMVKRIGFMDAASIFRTFHSYSLELLRKERAFLPFKVTDDVLPFSGEDYQLLFDLVKTYRAVVKSFLHSKSILKHGNAPTYRRSEPLMNLSDLRDIMAWHTEIMSAVVVNKVGLILIP